MKCDIKIGFFHINYVIFYDSYCCINYVARDTCDALFKVNMLTKLRSFFVDIGLFESLLIGSYAFRYEK